jgi:hypothetical protein
LDIEKQLERKMSDLDLDLDLDMDEEFGVAKKNKIIEKKGFHD